MHSLFGVFILFGCQEVLPVDFRLKVLAKFKSFNFFLMKSLSFLTKVETEENG